MSTSTNIPGTIWQKSVPFFGAPPQWVPIGQFAVGVPGQQGKQGDPGRKGDPGEQGAAGVPVNLYRGYIDGFVLSNDAGTPNTVLDIAAGVAVDTLTAGVFMTLASAITKNCNAAWALGSGSGGNLVASSLAASTWYHVFAFQTSTGGVDVGIDTDVGGANVPAVGPRILHRIGSIKTDGSSHIIAFHQYADEFYWDTSTLDVNVTNPGTAAVTRTLNVPTGLKVQPIFDATAFSTTVGTQVYFSSLDSADLAASYANCIQSGPTSTTALEGYCSARLWTNTSSQIRSRLTNSDGNMAVKIRTRGWLDPRGKNG